MSDLTSSLFVPEQLSLGEHNPLFNAVKLEAVNDDGSFVEVGEPTVVFIVSPEEAWWGAVVEVMMRCGRALPWVPSRTVESIGGFVWAFAREPLRTVEVEGVVGARSCRSLPARVALLVLGLVALGVAALLESYALVRCLAFAFAP